jgi:hypothetical protein
MMKFFGSIVMPQESAMTETPKYSILIKEKNFEIRQYPAYIQAEVEIDDKNHKGAVEKGFNILAGYIFGNNVSRQKIDMTAPVQASQKIAMTTPVVVSGDGTFRVAFIMPSAFTLETLPVPNDNRIHFVSLPEHQTAVVRFSGFFQPETIRKNTEQLRLWIEEKHLVTEGDYIVAGYNPPWVPGFLARNEILVRIKQ